MKKFNLELAKKGYEVCTRDGRNARIISFDRKNVNGYNIVALIDDNYNELIRTYTKKGYHDASIESESDLDLVMKPMKHEGWINIYNGDGSKNTGEGIYPSKESAILHRNELADYITTIKIEWEE